MADQGAQESQGLPAEVVAKIDETVAGLSATRRKRKTIEGYATAADVQSYTAKQTIPSLHSASPSGITSIAVSDVQEGVFLTGGNDKIVQLYDR